MFPPTPPPPSLQGTGVWWFCKTDNLLGRKRLWADFTVTNYCSKEFHHVKIAVGICVKTERFDIDCYLSWHDVFKKRDVLKERLAKRFTFYVCNTATQKCFHSPEESRSYSSKSDWIHFHVKEQRRSTIREHSGEILVKCSHTWCAGSLIFAEKGPGDVIQPTAHESESSLPRDVVATSATIRRNLVCNYNLLIDLYLSRFNSIMLFILIVWAVAL